MLTIIIEKRELFVEDKNEFITIPEVTLNLEHSLASIAEWEGKWHKPYLDEKEKTGMEIISYIQCMTIGQKPDLITYTNLTKKQMEEISEYISDQKTAANFKKRVGEGSSNRGEYISAETIYYQMIQLGIPFECQYWHLKRLLALIKFVDAKSKGQKKMSPKEEREQRKAIMAARRARHNGRG